MQKLEPQIKLFELAQKTCVAWNTKSILKKSFSFFFFLSILNNQIGQSMYIYKLEVICSYGFSNLYHYLISIVKIYLISLKLKVLINLHNP